MYEANPSLMGSSLRSIGYEQAPRLVHYRFNQCLVPAMVRSIQERSIVPLAFVMHTSGGRRADGESLVIATVCCALTNIHLENLSSK